MAIAKLNTRSGAIPGYHYSETIATGATGDDVVIPPLAPGKEITCTIVAGANTGYFQTTTDSDTAVAAGTATWKTWALGTSTGTVVDVITGTVTGIRGVSAFGEVRITIVI
jgi:hypothetical protein